MTSLEKSILATLAYYDVLDRPMTGWEIFRCLINYCKDRGSEAPIGRLAPKISLNNLLDVLETSPELAKFVNQKNGFYFLKGRQKIIKERINRQKIADQKWGKAKRFISFLQIIPFIRLVAVSGSLAMNNPKDESDIDLLIITQAGRIWTCRGLVTLFLHLIGQRRHGTLTKDRLCLNHYLTDQSLKIPFKSLYNAQTYIHLVPVLESKESNAPIRRDAPKLYKRFQRANQWMDDYLFNYPISQKGYLIKIKPNQFFNSIRQFNELVLEAKIGNSLEYILKKFQERRIRKNPLVHQAGGRVVVDERQLEFHPDSPEKKILEKYNQKMKELGFNELAQEKDSGLTI